ncbi:glycosyltransferase family 4 protein [Bradyrhizobium sp. LHD-71]|uniref:glycosyltransferase family 4 protein n=1 Tax=Bradyrhizobium sp. LHD-71 TaxID=3072141 RepID=UPI00280F9A35|nr:glycosyltransferase family 4 protein [Bradyrhizobium sp. LHD-71]MDQ8727733.1 glycosyltransferase family 4 protein [Bradyrhizobium sp. LHD-71]
MDRRMQLAMKLALAIVRLFPHGGLQRDCMAIARLLGAQGHQVTILTSRLEGDVGGDLDVETLPVRAWTNHGRNAAFSKALARRCTGKFDRIIGFDKLEGLDLLYCADPPVALRYRRRLSRVLPRERTLTLLERACFSREATTRLLLLSEPQADAYRSAWQTQAERITLLPPTVKAERRNPELRTDGTRKRLREEMSVAANDTVWLAIGHQLRVKGIDRTLEALGAFPDARLVIAGVTADSKAGRRLLRLAGRHGVRDRVRPAGIREDIPELMAAADLLVHPARTETTGTVILEAIVNGLPVAASAACGYAEHIVRANAGLVLPEPFSQAAYISGLREAKPSSLRKQWSANGVRYGETVDLYHGLARAASIMAGSA